MFSISFFYLSLIQINEYFYNFGYLAFYHTVNVITFLITLSLYYKKFKINHIWKIAYVGIFQLTFLMYLSSCSIKIIFDTIANKINPFSIMISKDPLTFGLLFFKVIMAYLIYQFIVSVRQNTRRK